MSAQELRGVAVVSMDRQGTRRRADCIFSKRRQIGCVDAVRVARELGCRRRKMSSNRFHIVSNDRVRIAATIWDGWPRVPVGEQGWGGNDMEAKVRDMFG